MILRALRQILKFMDVAKQLIGNQGSELLPLKIWLVALPTETQEWRLMMHVLASGTPRDTKCLDRSCLPSKESGTRWKDHCQDHSQPLYMLFSYRVVYLPSSPLHMHSPPQTNFHILQCSQATMDHCSIARSYHRKNKGCVLSGQSTEHYATFESNCPEFLRCLGPLWIWALWETSVENVDSNILPQTQWPAVWEG